MQIDLLDVTPDRAESDWLMLPTSEGADFDAHAAAIDRALGGTLSRMKASGDYTGKLAELARLMHVPGMASQRVLSVGLGTWKALTPARAYRAFLTAVREVCAKKERKLTIVLPEVADSTVSLADLAQLAAIAVRVGSSSQQLYRSEPDRHPLLSASILPPAKSNRQEIAAAIERGSIIGEAVNLTRELVNRHPGELYPETFADRASQLAASLGLACEVFDERRLSQERMNSLLGVARGSDRPPRMVVIEYRGGQAGQAPLALVGKGVTFDSGGLSLKQTDQMKTMKCDMAGAASVLGAVSAIARLKLPVHVVALMGLVENMPGSRAYKLGEVLTARNGTTIEVLNTDAEGRLVLADVLTYAVDRGVAKIVDLATLTGSCVIALGEEVAGAFTNDQPWCDQLLAAAKAAGEDVWQMPMFDSYNEQLKSDVADCKNVGTRWGGAITAAKFLEKFVAKTPWVHLDIAGPAWADSAKPHHDGGGTGAMVRTLIELAGSTT